MTLEAIHKEDLGFAVKCMLNNSNSLDDSENSRVNGGYTSLQPFRPIYFEDESYRSQRHDSIRTVIMVEEEEE
ncbi:hypothetical protein ACA910_006407 [Epithemia clementina (nom. ined.)]